MGVLKYPLKIAAATLPLLASATFGKLAQLSLFYIRAAAGKDSMTPVEEMFLFLKSSNNKGASWVAAANHCSSVNFS